MVLCAEPAVLFSPEARKGHLYIVAEAEGDVARGRDACQLVLRTIRKVFYNDSSYSVTAALRKAISAANKALYEHNFSVMAQKRAVVGVTCAVIKDNDLYLAQILPGQVYLLAEGKLRALPTHLSWNAAQTTGATAFLQPGAIGSSLSVEPDFYRGVLRPGDSILLCSSNLSRLLSREQVMRLARSPAPSDMVEGLLTLCKQNAMPEAHGIADHRSDDRDSARCSLGCDRARRVVGEQNVHVLCDDLVHEVGQPLDPALCPARYDYEVLPLDPAQFVKALPKDRYAARQRFRADETHACDFVCGVRGARKW